MTTRSLATVLFTDIVGSTERAAELGDRGWREVRSEHDRQVRRALRRFGGREINTAGDSFLATFDRPAAAIACADAIRSRIRELGLEVRAGLHMGEIEWVGGDVGGLGVNIGARVAAEAGPGEIWSRARCTTHWRARRSTSRIGAAINNLKDRYALSVCFGLFEQALAEQEKELEADEEGRQIEIPDDYVKGEQSRLAQAVLMTYEPDMVVLEEAVVEA